MDSHFNLCLPDRTYPEKKHELLDLLEQVDLLDLVEQVPALIEQVAQQDLPGSSFQPTSLQAYFVTLQDGDILNKNNRYLRKNGDKLGITFCLYSGAHKTM